MILGGTTEAQALAHLVGENRLTATVSLAGRVARPVEGPLPQRVGGFGGVAGLAQYLRVHKVTHVIDATHPFAAQMSRNAVAAAADVGIPLCALTRAPWRRESDDKWENVANMESAACALDGPPRRVFLAIGRMQLSTFANLRQHVFVLRLVDAPGAEPPLPNAHVVVARGPFREADDIALLRNHRIDVVVSKNAGGSGAYAKIAAARALGLPVIMIDRPPTPPRTEFHQAAEVMRWLGHASTFRGV